MTTKDLDNICLETSKFKSDGGHKIGRDPLEMDLDELRMLEHSESPIKAIQEKCIDCAGTKDEARKCVMYDCPLWAMRKGKNPFNKKRWKNRK